MGAIHYFEKDIREDSLGEPGERITTLDLYSFDSRIHFDVKVAGEVRPLRNMILSLAEARELASQLNAVADYLDKVSD